MIWNTYVVSFPLRGMARKLYAIAFSRRVEVRTKSNLFTKVYIFTKAYIIKHNIRHRENCQHFGDGLDIKSLDAKNY
jgi:hypothetical protein